MKYLLLLLTGLAISPAFAQSKHYLSLKNTINLANGNVTNVNQEKAVYFNLHVWEKTDDPNDKGLMTLQDVPFNSNDYSRRMYYESFKIYSIQLNNDGVYYYWTVDQVANSQVVLFEVNLNSAPSIIVMNRYAPSGGNKVLKRTTYYLE